MSLTFDNFRERLRHSGLLSAAEYSSLSPNQHSASAEQFAHQLVDEAKLTSFQAETLLAEHPQPLVLDE